MATRYAHMGLNHTDELFEAQITTDGYLDIFGDDHQNREPLLLDDGTSVWFPAGWTDEDADKWRKSMNLQGPGDATFASYH